MEKTKNKNKLIKRISAVLCALVVAVSTLGVSVPYYASHSVPPFDSVSYYADSYKGGKCVDVINQYNTYAIVEAFDTYILLCGVSFSITDGEIRVSGSSSKHHCFYFYEGKWCWALTGTGSVVSYAVASCGQKMDLITENNYYDYKVLYLSKDILDKYGDVVYSQGWQELQFEYNSSLGYLQNVRMHTVFDDVPLGETTGEKWTSRWYYDQYSTTGIDLTSGDYMINYYQERWIVKGYGTDDVVEKSDRYLLGTYIVQNGYIETYSEDIESTLAGQGYEEPSMLDLLWNKFITTHYYFQIVDAKNNQVGGVLHIYLTDDNGKFGVEHIGETLDDKGEYDDGGYKDFIEDDSITTDDVEQGFDELEQDNEQTLEEWLESFGGVGVDKLEGSDAFSTVFEGYVSQVAEVSNAVGAVFGVLPPWLLGSVGISFVLLIILMILKES